jgi:hypothetical protein
MRLGRTVHDGRLVQGLPSILVYRHHPIVFLELFALPLRAVGIVRGPNPLSFRAGTSSKTILAVTIWESQQLFGAMTCLADMTVFRSDTLRLFPDLPTVQTSSKLRFHRGSMDPILRLRIPVLTVSRVNGSDF